MTSAKPYTRKTQYHETDQMGIIHHANYIKWFEEARVDFLDQLGYGYEKSLEAGIDFALTKISCDYIKMTRFGDTVDIYCHISSLGRMRVSVGYKVVNRSTGDIVASGESGHCFFSSVKGRPVALSKELPDLYNLLERIKTAPEN